MILNPLPSLRCGLKGGRHFSLESDLSHQLPLLFSELTPLTLQFGQMTAEIVERKPLRCKSSGEKGRKTFGNATQRQLHPAQIFRGTVRRPASKIRARVHQLDQ
jgi:hypothetical protein